MSINREEVERRRMRPLATPTDLSKEASADTSASLTTLLADVFSLYVKTKNFHWHMSGPHFCEYHRVLDEQGDELLSMTDALAERARKIGGATIRSVGHISRLSRLSDNDADFVTPKDMMAELCQDNRALVAAMRATHDLTSELRDVATTSLLENWIDQAERRAWFLFETGRDVQ
ncbi:Dps family protein [Pararhizobium sp. DWP1-1-3]|uniref:Dps family protein n=1 Tax=Pararhizobium sp. DWP1-1-3 TaxID=2804652 RepID=UPI003CECEB44